MHTFIVVKYLISIALLLIERIQYGKIIASLYLLHTYMGLHRTLCCALISNVGSKSIISNRCGPLFSFVLIFKLKHPFFDREIHGNYISGTLPPAMDYLDSLVEHKLGRNPISGTVPAFTRPKK